MILNGEVSRYLDEEGLTEMTEAEAWKEIAKHLPGGKVSVLKGNSRHWTDCAISTEEFYEGESTPVGLSTVYDHIKRQVRKGVEWYIHKIAALGIGPGKRVVDIGCASGLEACFFSQLVGEQGRVIGIDIAPGMIKAAKLRAKRRKLRNVEFKVGTLDQLELPDSSADFALCCQFLINPDDCGLGFQHEIHYHLTEERRISELTRILDTNGRLAVVSLASEPYAVELRRREFDYILEHFGYKDISYENEMFDNHGEQYGYLVISGTKK